MSNPIEVPENIIALAKKILEDSTCYGDNSLEIASYITMATRPETVVEDFVIYKVKVRGYDEPRMGFQVSRRVPYPWVTLDCNAQGKENAYALAAESSIHSSGDITVIERWTPEAPKIEFGLGGPDDSVDVDRKVLVKGVLHSGYVDPDGDVRVEMNYSDTLTEIHYVSANDVAYAKEA